MDQLLLLNPGINRVDIALMLEQYSARRLGEFSEADDCFSVWELADVNQTVFEFEYHWNPSNNIHYLCLRENPPASLLAWLNQQQLLATTEAILALLCDANTENRMTGLAMVALNPQSYFADALFGLRNDSDQDVRQLAQELFERLFQVKPEQLALPETHLQASVQDRRQLLRWVMHNQTAAPATPAITQLINQSLKDADWEVRVSAMIVCARFHLVSLAPLIPAVTLPSASAVTKRDLEIFHAIQKVVLFILSDQRPEAMLREGKQARWFKLYQLIVGEQSSNSSHTALDCLDAIIHYFTAPFPGHQHPPPVHPSVVAMGEKYFLANTPIELCWIPESFYWSEVESSENEFIYKMQSPGFFISRYHYSQKGECDDELPSASLAAQVDALSKTLNVPLSLPTRGQWLSAMCGTDARNYVWGWGLQADWMLHASPWGLMQSWSEQGEWVYENGEYKVVGVVGQSLHSVKSMDNKLDSLSLP